MKVLTIVGARPQFVKAAVVSQAVRKMGSEILLHTGQHYDENMSKVFFDELGLPRPDINLDIGGGSHAEQTGRMLVGIERVIKAEAPEWVLVYGDTNSTLAGALAAVKLHVPVAHVEAGLRSYNRAMPEEINRVLTDQISDALFVPTELAVRNLAAEGVTRGVYQVGDVMGDALDAFLPAARQKSTVLEKLKLQPKTYALATVHRAANTDDPQRLQAILTAFSRLSMPVIFPVHPRTRGVIASLGIQPAGNLRLVEPVGYLDMLVLEAGADCILTDSGGVQKEAYWMGVRCVTLRDETEWVETVQVGWNFLVGADTEKIVSTFETWRPDAARPQIYGDGQAARRIVETLVELTGKSPSELTR
jgi:UDP-N-acetylglucosamine 2-epimerase